MRIWGVRQNLCAPTTIARSHEVLRPAARRRAKPARMRPSGRRPAIGYGFACVAPPLGLHPTPRWGCGPFGDAGWSSPVARQAHNLKVVSSNLAPATILALTADPKASFISPSVLCRSSASKHPVVLGSNPQAYIEFSRSKEKTDAYILGRGIFFGFPTPYAI